jgi:hypothetical protein
LTIPRDVRYGPPTTETATTEAIVTSTIVKCSDLKPGDKITEVDTPEGPFYAVAKVNAKSVVVRDEEYDITLRLPFLPTDVRRGGPVRRAGGLG